MTTKRITVNTQSAGDLQCDVQGDLEHATAVILTVHDLGCNSVSWSNFVNHPVNAEVTARATWLHVNVPGHEQNAPDLPSNFKYPSMDDLAAALEEISESVIHCPVIGVGEGAGANIIARWALTNPKRLHGAVLIHCTSTTAGFLETMKDKTINFKLLGGMNPTAENYLIMHRFGDFSKATDAEQVQSVVMEYHTELNERMNAKNIRGYIECFRSRSNIAEKMGQLNTPTLMITGELASHNHTCHTLYNAAIRAIANRKLVEFIEISKVANVVEGAPVKLGESMLYFMQGCGVLGGAKMPHLNLVQRRDSRTMAELDKSDI